MNTTALSCIAPIVTSNPVIIAYRLILDDVPPPDPTRPELLLSLRPNPGNFMLTTTEVSFFSSLVRIRVCLLKNHDSNFICFLQGNNIDSVTFSEIGVNVGGRICEIISILPTEVTEIYF